MDEGPGRESSEGRWGGKSFDAMEVETEIKKVLDIRALCRSRFPTLHRFTPLPLFRLASLLLRERELNEKYQRIKHLNGGDFMQGTLDVFDISLRVEGIENLSGDGRPLVVGNHPMGVADGVGLLRTVFSKHPIVKSMSNDLLEVFPNMRDIILSVNKIGKNPRENVRKVVQMLHGEGAIVLFPALSWSKKSGGRVTDLPWSQEFVKWSVKYNRDVVPVYVDGRNSDFFYWFTGVRRRLGISAKLETSLLMNEVFRLSGTTLTLKVGRPISWKRLRGSKDGIRPGDLVRRYLYMLGQSSAPSGSCKEFPRIVD